jgi:hypothetical protein
MLILLTIAYNIKNYGRFEPYSLKIRNIVKISLFVIGALFVSVYGVRLAYGWKG